MFWSLRSATAIGRGISWSCPRAHLILRNTNSLNQNGRWTFSDFIRSIKIAIFAVLQKCLTLTGVSRYDSVSSNSGNPPSASQYSSCSRGWRSLVAKIIRLFLFLRIIANSNGKFHLSCDVTSITWCSFKSEGPETDHNNGLTFVTKRLSVSVPHLHVAHMISWLLGHSGGKIASMYCVLIENKMARNMCPSATEMLKAVRFGVSKWNQ
jgi:hypothetical protein